MFKKQKINESEVLKFGFLGGIAEAAYVLMVASLITALGKFFPQQPKGIAGPALVLLLLVFSAAVSGILVFGYPVYLAFQKRFAESLMTVVITLASLAIIGIMVFLLVTLI